MKKNRIAPLPGTPSHQDDAPLPKPSLPPIHPAAAESIKTASRTSTGAEFNVEKVRRRSNAKTTQLWGADYHKQHDANTHHNMVTELDENKLSIIEQAVFSDSEDELTAEDKKVTLALGFSSLKINVPDTLSQRTGISRTSSHVTRFFRASPKSKLCKRVFRSGWSIRREQDRQFEQNQWIIHPFSIFRWYWELIMITVLLSDLVILPVYIAFYSEPSKSGSLTYLMISFDLVFILDIMMNFRTGYMDSDTEVVILKPRRIAAYYLRTWFFVDAFSSIPFDLIFLIIGVDQMQGDTIVTLKILKLTKLVSLLRVLRMARLLRYVHRLEELLGIDAVFIRIVNLILLTLMISHWNGCMQYLVVYVMDYPPDSWVVMRNLKDASVFKKYTQAVFRAMSHMLCIGYGKEPPDSLSEQWVTITSMLLGASFYALFIGNMSSLLMNMDASGRLYNEKITQVKEYMRYRKLPRKTQERVIQYYEHKYQRKFFDEGAILNDKHMSHAIRKEIMLHNCQKLVSKVSFLASSPPEVLCDIISYLEFEVFLPGDHIIEAGRRGNSMYFIEFGAVQVVLPNGDVVNTLYDGAHFGEISLIMDERRVASVVASEVCDVFRLTREHFLRVVDDFPWMREEMEQVVHDRLAQIQRPVKTGDEVISMSDADSSSSLEEIRTVVTGPFSVPTSHHGHVSHHINGDPSFHRVYV